MCFCLGTLVIRPPETPRDRSKTPLKRPPKSEVPSADDAVVKTLPEHSRADNAMCMCARVSVSVCVLLGQRAPSRMQSLFRLSSHRMHVRCGKEQPPASECGPGPSLCVRVCVCVCVCLLDPGQCPHSIISVSLHTVFTLSHLQSAAQPVNMSWVLG